MAQDTFSNLWNRLLLYAPGLPVPLAQEFVRIAYRRALDMHYWSELYTDGEQTLPTTYSTGTVSCTKGSAAVTGTDTAWTAAMIGRQISFENNPPAYYTITAVGSGTALTLDRAYEGETDSSQTYIIAQYYVEFPSDLAALDGIRDYSQNWVLLPQHFQQTQIDHLDSNRSDEGSPEFYVAAPPRVLNGVSYPRYEFYPKIPAGTKLVYRYIKDSELTSNSSRIITMLKPEAVIYGAIAQLAVFPGYPERPNPYFSTEIHKSYTKLFEDVVHDSEMADLDRMQQMLLPATGCSFPSDANSLRARGIPF